MSSHEAEEAATNRPQIRRPLQTRPVQHSAKSVASCLTRPARWPNDPHKTEWNPTPSTRRRATLLEKCCTMLHATRSGRWATPYNGMKTHPTHAAPCNTSRKVLHEFARHPPRLAQLGRASCRERGGQEG